MEKIDWNEWFYYDETSPSCLRWKTNRDNKVKKDDVAGSIDFEGYYRVRLHGKAYKCHRIIYEIFNNVLLKSDQQIDHINRCRYDNRIENLRVVTNAENSRNTKIYQNNKTGVVGVSEDKKGKGRFYYVAHWNDLDGKFNKKHFSIKKLGLLPAFAQAVAYRKKMITELNEQGAGYSDRHGT